MKNKIKKICCSLFVTLALLAGSFFGLTSGVVNFATNLAAAKYESKLENSYEFTGSGDWTSLQLTTVADKDLNLSDKITSSNNQDITKLEAGTYTPAKRAESKDDYVLYIKANQAPSQVLSYKTDEKGKQVYKTDAKGNYVYEKDEKDPTKDAIFETNNGDSELYVQVKDGDKFVYKKKIKETQIVNTSSFFRINNSINLSKNNWYVLSAWVWTKDAYASLGVSGTGFNAEYKNITTTGEWKYVQLFLETPSDADASVYINFYYGRKLSEDKLKGGIVENPASNQYATGAVYLDDVKLTKINQTDYINKTVDGKSSTTYIASYSARYNLNDRLSESNFESFNPAADIYSSMFGQDTYDKTIAESKDFQNYVFKYRDNSTSDKYEDYELETYHDLYNNSNKFSVSVVSEETEKDLRVTQDVLGEDGKPTYDKDNNKITEEVGYNTFGKNNKVLKIENNSRYSLGLLSAPITIDRFGYYRLSLYVKGVDEEDSATIKLISYIKTGTNANEGALQLAHNTIDAYSSNLDATNNWVEVVFYIRASTLHDTQSFQIALLADKHSTIYFDNIRLENATQSGYSASTKTLDLAPSSTLISKGVNNGYFNYIELTTEQLEELNRKTNITHDDYDADYSLLPYKPLNWSKNTGSDDKVVAGIVPTTVAEYNNIKAKLGNALNPIGLDQNGIALPKTNVLAIYSPADAKNDELTRTYSYKSESFQLSANSVYKISFKVMADVNFSGKITATVANDSKSLAEFSSEVSTGEWHTFTMVIRTDSNSKSCNLNLGVKDALGTVFFQEVRSEALSKKETTNDKGEKEEISVDTQYNEIFDAYKALTSDVQAKNPMTFSDFAQDASAIHSANKVEIVDSKDSSLITYKDYYASLGFKLEEYPKDKKVEQGELGVVDTTKDVKLSDSYTILASKLNNPKAKNDAALLIYNSKELQTKVNSLKNNSLAGDSFYEISFYAKTDAIAQGKGLTVRIDQLSVEFANINTEHNSYGDLTDSNGYKKFTVLVRTGESSISSLNIAFILGTEDNKFAGTALLSSVKIEKLADQEAYETLVNAVDANDQTTIVKNFHVDEVKEEDEPVDDLTLEIFFLVFSSILLVVALIIAIISVYVRRIPKTHTVVGENKANLKKKKNQEVETDQKDGFV